MKLQNIKRKAQRGFTLIELMIVVAIIGILAAVAIPAYQDYVTKAKLAKVTTAVESVKTAVAQFAQENGGSVASITTDGWTSLGLPAGGPTTTTEVSAISVTAATGEIVATLQNIKPNTIDGKKIKWLPQPGATALTWTVSTDSSDPVVTSAITKW